MRMCGAFAELRIEITPSYVLWAKATPVAQLKPKGFLFFFAPMHTSLARTTAQD